jgi:hypothetical protein
MKLSSGLLGPCRSDTGGTGTASGSGRKAQCGLYSAPSAIQRRRVSISSGPRLSFDFRGGMRLPSVAVIRWKSRLSSGLPGTMAPFAIAL